MLELDEVPATKLIGFAIFDAQTLGSDPEQRLPEGIRVLTLETEYRREDASLVPPARVAHAQTIVA